MSLLSQNYLKQIVVNLLWGAGFVAGNIVAQAMPPWTAACFRFIIAAVVLLIALYAKGGRLPRLQRKEALIVIGMAVIGMAVYNYFFISGLKTVEASYASMIMALNPVLVALISAIIFKDKLRPVQILGIIVSAFGAVFIICEGNLADLFRHSLSSGEIYILLGLAAWVIYTFLNRLAQQTLEPLAAVTWACLIAAIVLIIPAYWESGFERELIMALDWPVWVSLFVLGGLCSALAFTWYYASIGIIGTSRSGVFYNLSPIFATIAAIIILDEQPGWSFAVGAVAVISGVLLTNYKKQAPAKGEEG